MGVMLWGVEKTDMERRKVRREETKGEKRIKIMEVRGKTVNETSG